MSLQVNQAQAGSWGTRPHGGRLSHESCCDLWRKTRFNTVNYHWREIQHSRRDDLGQCIPLEVKLPAHSICCTSSAISLLTYFCTHVSCSTRTHMGCPCIRSPERGNSSWTLSPESWTSRRVPYPQTTGKTPNPQRKGLNHVSTMSEITQNGFSNGHMFLYTCKYLFLCSNIHCLRHVCLFNDQCFCCYASFSTIEHAHYSNDTHSFNYFIKCIIY